MFFLHPEGRANALSTCQQWNEPNQSLVCRCWRHFCRSLVHMKRESPRLKHQLLSNCEAQCQNPALRFCLVHMLCYYYFTFRWVFHYFVGIHLRIYLLSLVISHLKKTPLSQVWYFSLKLYYSALSWTPESVSSSGQ